MTPSMELVIPPGGSLARPLDGTLRPRWWWLHYVTGFDDRKHCLACLRGVHSKRVGLSMAPKVMLIEATAPYLYLCGGFWRYERNFHVAMAPDPSSEFEAIAFNGVRVHFRGLRRLEIPDLPDELAGYSIAQTTCRNFRFGYSVFGSSSSARR